MMPECLFGSSRVEALVILILAILVDPRCHGEWIEGRHPPESCYWCGYPAPEDSEEVVLLPHGDSPINWTEEEADDV